MSHRTMNASSEVFLFFQTRQTLDKGVHASTYWSLILHHIYGFPSPYVNFSLSSDNEIQSLFANNSSVTPTAANV